MSGGGVVKVVPVDQMPRWPWEPPYRVWMTINLYDRWIGLYVQTYFWMRAHRVVR
jgi:hypothetical protein